MKAAPPQPPASPWHCLKPRRKPPRNNRVPPPPLVREPSQGGSPCPAACWMPVRPASPALRFSLPARTLFPCYSADLKPASEVLVSASGCTVLFSVEPPAAGTTASWEYESGPRKAVIATYVPNKSAEISRIYEGRVSFNEMDFSLQMVLRWWDGGLYRFRSESEATGWFELRVVEPLSEPEILGNSSVEVGGDTKLFCNVLEGQVDLYWWKRNGELLMESNGLHFVHNNTLEIHRALMNDTGYYTCIVSNAVSQNETSFLLRVHSKRGFLPRAREWKAGKWPQNVQSGPIPWGLVVSQHHLR
ncbi:HEPACAM family member 2-like isoform X1 [Anser cygnoides]|uniref:HEPACAM family member 2-like isoform X1 n=1 Tax=Anser cygnoides TaxID=8845 RepID=UPI0034D2BD57